MLYAFIWLKTWCSIFWLLTVLVLSASGGTKLGHVTGRWNDHPDNTSIRSHSGGGITGRGRSGSFSGNATGSYCHHGTQQVEAGVGNNWDCRSVLRETHSSSVRGDRDIFKFIRHWRLGCFVFYSPGSGVPRPLCVLDKHCNTELLHFGS